jgi:hypothetical protein
MEISNEYKSRHGIAYFNKKVFQITNNKEQPNIICSLIKVPTYSFKHTYTEKICEGNGWYSKGETITETITHDFYWLVVLNGKCLGVINENAKKSISTKFAIENLNNKKQIKEFIKTL